MAFSSSWGRGKNIIDCNGFTKLRILVPAGNSPYGQKASVPSAEGIDSRSHCWDEAIVTRYFHPWDVAEILKIKQPLRERDDVVAWHHEKTRVFSVWSAYPLVEMPIYMTKNLVTC